MINIIVVGTGIVGAVTSYQLVQRNVHVTMVDSNEEGRSTYVAAGMINPWTTKRRNKAWYTLANAGAIFYDQLISELRTDNETNFGYKKVGSIHLHHNEDKLNELYEIVKKRRQQELAIGNIHILDEEEAFKQFPFTNKNYKGLYISGAGRINGRLLTAALINASKKRNANYVVGRAELVMKSDKIIGVKVNNETIEADAVVITNGIWMPQTLKNIGLTMELTIRKGEIIHLQTDKTTDHLPVIMPPNNKYILPFENGRIAVGTTFKRTDFNHKSIEFTTDGMHEILHETLQVAPHLKSSTICEMKVGFRPYTANSLPLFGPVPSVQRLYAANGLGASGLSTGPMIGLQLAKLITSEALDVHLADYSLEQAIQQL